MQTRKRRKSYYRAHSIEVYFDGLCEPVNPHGIATYGFVIYANSGVRRYKLHEGSGVVGAGCLGNDVTNNVAEYTALIKALDWLFQNNLTDKPVVVMGDSQLTIRQLNGVYGVRARRVVPLYNKVVELANKFKNIKFTWIPREYNEEADSLSRRSYYEFCKKNEEIVKKHYEKYLMTNKQRRYILYLAKKKGVKVKINEFMSKREASKLIDKLLSG